MVTRANEPRADWIRYLIRRCRAHPRAVSGAAAGAAGAALLTAGLPLVVRHVVDTLTTSAASVLPWAFLLVGLGLLRFGAAFVRRVSSSQLSLGVQHDLRRDLFAALLRLDGRAQGELRTGQVVSRAITDVTLIQMFLQLIPIVTGNVLLLIAALVLMTVMSPTLTLIAVLVVPALWILTRRSQRQLFPANWDAQARAAEVAIRVEAAVAGVRVVKGFGQERRELDGLAESARDLYRSRLRVNRITSRFTPAVQSVPAIGQALILVLGGLLALNASLSLGTFLAFMTYLGSFVAPIRQFAMLLTVSQQGRAALDRVREVIEAPPVSTASAGVSGGAAAAGDAVAAASGAAADYRRAVADSTGAPRPAVTAEPRPAAGDNTAEPRPSAGDNIAEHRPSAGDNTARSRRTVAAAPPPGLGFHGVTVTFGNTTVLGGLDLTIEPGETIAIAGGAGSGKSTLAQLIPRLFDPDAGSVTLGGTDIRELPGVRAEVAMVFEDTHLVAGTVRANVAYGVPDASDEAIRHALHLAAADEFVAALPQGLDTRIGERGQRLSGGQRQRIALARALLTDAPVLVLDDATSAIDARVEERIFRRIAAEVRGRTTVIVAHRMSTLALADRVAVLDGGRVAELGSLARLRASGELFRALFTPPDISEIDAGIHAEAPRSTTEPLWIEPAGSADDDRTLEQAAAAFSQRAAGAPTGLGRGGAGGGMMTAAPPSGDVRAQIDALPPVSGEPEVPDSFARTPDPEFGTARLLRPFAAPLLAGLGLVALDALAQILIPVLVRYGIDHGVLAGAGHVVLIAAAAALVVCLVDWGIGTAQLRVMGRAGERLLYGLRVKTFAHLQRLGLQFYERELGGRIMTRMTTDVDGLSAFLQTGLATALTSMLTVAGVVIALLVIEPHLALVVLVLLPILVVSTATFRRLSVPAYVLARERVSAVNAYLQENVDTIAVTQAYRREGHNRAEFERRSWSYRNARLRSQLLMAVFFPFIELMSVIATAAVLTVGVRDVRAGVLTAGTLIAFLLYIDLLFTPIQQLSQVFDSYQQAVVGVDRLGELLRTPVATPEHAEAVPVRRLEGRIELRDVAFAYHPETPEVLTGVGLSIAAGQKVALVGETGAGKSTLVKLLARFYDPTAGTVLIDGVDLRRYRLADFRARLGIVPQEPFLFGETVRAAIAYGRPEADPAEIEWAARAVGAHEMIAGLRHGYHHPIGPNGRALSAGQRQLLALARAQLVEPDILILDEATASLDLATEARVRAAVDVLTAGRTTLVVAHRLATAADADLIVVVRGGRIEQTGTHADLLAADGPYRELWAAYVGDSAGQLTPAD